MARGHRDTKAAVDLLDDLEVARQQAAQQLRRSAL